MTAVEGLPWPPSADAPIPPVGDEAGNRRGFLLKT